MNVELLTCQRMTAGLVYPPYPLQQPQVNQIYADISLRYPFQSLQHLPDGARMANPAGDFFIRATLMQVNDGVDFFPSSKERAMDLFQIAQERLQVPQFTVFGIKLTALLPLQEQKKRRGSAGACRAGQNREQSGPARAGQAGRWAANSAAPGRDQGTEDRAVFQRPEPIIYRVGYPASHRFQRYLYHRTVDGFGL